MRFARGNDGVNFVNAAIGGLQRSIRRLGAKGDFRFAVNGIGERFDPSAFAQLSDRHSKSTIDVGGRNNARTKSESGPGDNRRCLRLRLRCAFAQTVIHLFIGDEHGR